MSGLTDRGRDRDMSQGALTCQVTCTCEPMVISSWAAVRARVAGVVKYEKKGPEEEPAHFVVCQACPGISRSEWKAEETRLVF